MFEIRTVPSCPSKLLHAYQACEIFGINATGIYEVKTKTKSFQTTIYPFLQTDFLIDELIGKAHFWEVFHRIKLLLAVSKARQNFSNPSTFTYVEFSFNVVRIFFDQLHGVQTNTVSLEDALEIMVFCNHLGQIDRKSNFETRLYDELCKSIMDTIKVPKQMCFIWLFLRSWGPSGRD